MLSGPRQPLPNMIEVRGMDIDLCSLVATDNFAAYLEECIHCMLSLVHRTTQTKVADCMSSVVDFHGIVYTPPCRCATQSVVSSVKVNAVLVG